MAGRSLADSAPTLPPSLLLNRPYDANPVTAVGRVSGRLFLSSSPVSRSLSLSSPLSRRHRGYSVAIPNTSGKQPTPPRDATMAIVSFKNRKQLRRRLPQRGLLFRPTASSLPRPFDTHSLGVNYTRRGSRKRNALTLPMSRSPLPARTTHMLFTISQ